MRSLHQPLLGFFVLAFSLTATLSGAYAQNVFLNEVDADNNSVPDSLEFVELFSGPNVPLDGHIVVFYKGGGNTVTTNVYAAFDLDGMSTDSLGFFVLGNPAIEAATVIFEPGLLRDGGDAVALFEGDSADFVNGTPLTTTGLLDAVVYGTGDQTNPFLIDSLTPGQPQLDEWMLGPQNGGALAWSRLPDGGPAFSSDQMVLQQPTPGYTNLLDCDGGLIEAQGAVDGVASVCGLGRGISSVYRQHQCFGEHICVGHHRHGRRCSGCGSRWPRKFGLQLYRLASRAMFGLGNELRWRLGGLQH